MRSKTFIFGFDDSFFDSIHRVQDSITSKNTPLMKSILQTQQSFFALNQPVIEVAQRAALIADMIPPAVYEIAAQYQRILEQISPILEYQSRLSAFGVELSQIFTRIQQSNTNTADLFGWAEEIALNPSDNSSGETQWEQLSREETEQVVGAVSSIIENPQNWQQRWIDAIRHFETANPIIAEVLRKIAWIILTILTTVMGTLLAAAIQNASVREKPVSTAPIICQIEIDQSFYIIGEVPYYYYIEFKNKKTGQEVFGYISKRTVKVPFWEDITSKREENDACLPLNESER
jgi:hypothetical protein